MKKVLLVTEYLNPPYDEGIKKTAFHLFNEIKNKYDVKVICRKGFPDNNIYTINTNQLFFSKNVFKMIREFNPQILIYLPFCAATFASYMRLKTLKLFAPGIKSIFIALQYKSISRWQKKFISFLKPETAFTSSLELKQFWEKEGIESELVPITANLDQFKPIKGEEKKTELRKKFGLPADKFILTHVGHLNYSRNLKKLMPLQGNGNQVIFVSSSSTPKDAIGPNDLKKELENAGIIVMNRYIPDIEVIYQLSDCYVFPVKKESSAISLPLSVLEARACGLPVLTTDFGSIRTFLDDDNGMISYSAPEEFPVKLNLIKDKKDQQYKTSVKSLNKKGVERIINSL
jgi:glycosyltransferase involved in cell wall biosynthesis